MKQEKYAEAFEIFNLLETLADLKSNLLEARVGMMRTAQLLNRHQDVIEAAAKVLITDKLPAEIERETRFVRANALIALNRETDAFDEYARVSANLRTAEGAEAKYRMVRIYFDSGELTKAENEVFNFAERNTPHQYWLAQSFIVLADIYALRDDFFQAKSTLQSVIDGYGNPNDGVIDLRSEERRVW